MESYYKNLDVWKKSILLTKSVYSLTRNFPTTEIYGLTNQMRRASVSIGSNIAEGSSRGSKPDFARFLYIAKGSCAELETQLIIAKELGFTEKGNIQELENLIEDILKMLSRLIKSQQEAASERKTNYS